MMQRTGVSIHNPFLRPTALIALLGLLTLMASCGGGSSHTNSGTLLLSSPTMTYSYIKGLTGEANPDPQTLTISDSTGAADISATSDSTWLVVLPSNGVTPVQVSITVLPVGLDAKTYTGYVTLQSSKSVAYLKVTMTVLDTPTKPVMTVYPTSLAFSATQGGANPQDQVLTVKNINPTSTPGDMIFTTASDSAWLAVSPATGTATGAVFVHTVPGTLAAGTYNGNVTITAPDAVTTSATVPVTFTVTNPTP